MIRLMFASVCVPVLIVALTSTIRAEERSGNHIPAETESATALTLGNATITDLQVAFMEGSLTAESLVQRYLYRIEAYNGNGPSINSVITLNPEALAQAKILDAERSQGRLRGPLHGIPFSLKDNINTGDLPTTAGSCLFIDSAPMEDAFVVKRLRNAGAILLSKDNLSEFASGGGSVAGATHPAILKAGDIPQGYSSTGGQTRNPHAPDHSPAGSSGGTGAGVAAAFAQFGLGSDTKSSVRGPAAVNGIVGLRPTMGLVSRSGLVPLSLSFDTIGPMARNVYDVAVVLGVITGSDPDDAITLTDKSRSEGEYTKFLDIGALQGARIGIGRDFIGDDPEINRLFDEAVAMLRRLGAEVVDPVWFPQYVLAMANEPIFPLIRNAEFKAQLAGYLETLAPSYPKTLDELVTMANAPDSCYMDSSPQKAFALRYSAAHALDLDDPVYLAALEHGVSLVRSSTQAVFDKHRLDAMVFPTVSRLASPITPQDTGAGLAALPDGNIALDNALADGSRNVQPGRSGRHQSGMTEAGLPIAISFVGRAHTESELLGYGYDFEQAMGARALPDSTPGLATDIIVR